MPHIIVEYMHLARNQSIEEVADLSIYLEKTLGIGYFNKNKKN